MRKNLSKALIWVLAAAMLISLMPAALASGSEYDSSDAVSFVFTDSAIATGDTTHTSNYEIEDTDLMIKAAGTYVLSGSCSNGSVTVKKGTTGVTIVLNSLSLTNAGSEKSATAPLTCNKSTGVKIIAAAGTVNTLTDSIYNNDETYTTNEDAENAVIKCKDGSQVTISGSGTLNIVSNGKNGIKSGTTDSETDASSPRDAYLTIENVTMNITASVNDAINAEQELDILSGTLTISAADDAIHSDYALTIGATGTTGPTIKITKSNEGIEGATINICSGDISILSSDDCMNAANSDLSSYSFSLNISGGKLYAYTTSGDGFDSNGSLTISGGTVEVWSANTADNQPLDAESTVTISGGTVFAAGGSSGMGTKLNASQTCITFGNSGSQQMGGMQPGAQGGMQMPSQQQGPQNGMKMGSMGNQQMNPQQTGAQGGQQPGNNQPDSQQNTQGSQQISGQTASVTSGASVSVVNSSGTALYTATAPCNASYVLFSSSSLSSSETYSLKSGSNTVTGTEATSTAAGGAGNMPGGTAPTGAQGSADGTTPPEKPADGTAPAGNTASTGSVFQDVSTGDWYYDSVLWAYKNGITSGTDDTHFSPLSQITRAQMVTLIWNAAGKPEPTNTTTSFTDVDSSAYYAKAVAWAAEKGITSGTGDGTTFSPDSVIDRAQAVTMLYKYSAFDTLEIKDNPFSDITDGTWYTDAVLWAYKNGITSGTGDGTTFSPFATCTRAQGVSFIYNLIGNI